ncbi:hypothetical protein BcDW1_4662 [Botrytis cinerea BcDW1]|uniref:Uncharacterized protein n=1 Tax=Botryotinia fuckeliana (strain BcDW1) TaxID=1290391 RepID=M7TZE4_BOTF1|nr:hypothetical protein BcDW1_4662 [Botrytis cinerea BcDW1]
MIEDKLNRRPPIVALPLIANGSIGHQPMEFNSPNSNYPKREIHRLSKNTLAPIEENGESSQQSPDAHKDNTKFNTQFPEHNANASQFSSQATIANYQVSYQLQQWDDGNSNKISPMILNGSNSGQAQIEANNRSDINHPDLNGAYDPLRAIPLSELRNQLTSIAREIKLRTVDSMTAASDHVKPQGNQEYLMLYLVVLGQFILQGGQAYFIDLPPPAPQIIISPQDTDSFSLSPPESGGVLVDPDEFEIDSEHSSGLPMNDNDNDDTGYSFLSPNPRLGNSNTTLSLEPRTRVSPLSPLAPAFVPASEGHQKVSGVAGDNVALKSPPTPVSLKSYFEPAKARIYPQSITSVSSVEEKMPADPFATQDTPNSTTPPVESLQQSPLNSSTPLTPISPVLHTSPPALDSPTPRDRLITHSQLRIPSNICFIRTKPGSGIRIYILPNQIGNSETTWIDLPEVGIQLCDEDTPEKFVYATNTVMGSASWFYTEIWVSYLYQEILIYNSFRGLGNLERASISFEPEPSMIPTGCIDMYGRPTFFDAGNSRSEPKTLSFPSGDDLGVNWNAAPHENARIRSIKLKQMWEGWQEGARDVRWLWHLWKQWGRIKGWTEKSEKCGDDENRKGKNAVDHFELMKIAMLTSKIEYGIKQIGFDDMKGVLRGRSTDQLKRDWEERTRKFGS